MNYRFDWTYPNMGKFYRGREPIRGSLTSRFVSASDFGLTRIEVPFDLVRLENDEYYVLKKKVGDIFDKSDFKYLYGASNNVIKGEYILHTDPELRPRHYLYWDLVQWRNRYLDSIVDFSKFVNKIPFAVEIHSGKTKRSKGYFEDFIIEVLGRFSDEYGLDAPDIFVENRTGLYISTVTDMVTLYDEIGSRTTSVEREKFGFSIDVSQLHSEMGLAFASEIGNIPNKAIKNWHIHFGAHRPPTSRDPIDWSQIVRLIKDNPQSICLPEVFTNHDVKLTIQFIENLL